MNKTSKYNAKMEVIIIVFGENSELVRCISLCPLVLLRLREQQLKLGLQAEEQENGSQEIQINKRRSSKIL